MAVCLTISRLRCATSKNAACRRFGGSQDATVLYAANLWGGQVTRLDLDVAAKTWELQLSGAADKSTNARVQPPSDVDVAAATKRQEALLDEAKAADFFPYACRLDERRQRLYVRPLGSCLGRGHRHQVRPTPRALACGEHPNEMLLNKSGSLLFVANANWNTVTVLMPRMAGQSRLSRRRFTPTHRPVQRQTAWP